MKHKFKVMSKEEVLANRSNAYEFADFNKKETIEEAFDRIFDSIDYILFDYASFEQGAKWQKEQYTVEEQFVEHSINDLDKSYMKGFNEGAEWQKAEIADAINFGIWLSLNCKQSNSKDAWWIYNKKWKTTHELLEIYKKEKE